MTAVSVWVSELDAILVKDTLISEQLTPRVMQQRQAKDPSVLGVCVYVCVSGMHVGEEIELVSKDEAPG